MNHRDVWFVGLLALAYLYLDAAAPPARREAVARNQPLPLPDDSPAQEPLGFAPAEACPRDLTHLVSLRRDGAKWCLSCDEAFYPAGLVI